MESRPDRAGGRAVNFVAVVVTLHPPLVHAAFTDPIRAEEWMARHPCSHAVMMVAYAPLDPRDDDDA
jgi:hypothetical protein